MQGPPRRLDAGKAVSVGRILAAHGVHGELKVQPLTDFPTRFERGAVLWLADKPHSVESSRWQKGSLVLKLAGIDSRDQAEKLRGQDLLLPEPAPLPEGQDIYYQHDVIGLEVRTPTGEVLGRVADILSTGANDVYLVRGERGELLLPAITDVVREVDIDGGSMVIELLPGLEFQRRPEGMPRRRTPSRGAATRRRRPG